MSVHYQGRTRGAGDADARGPREMNRRQRAKTVIELEPRRATSTGTEPGRALEPDPLYGVALLKTALELKRRKDGTPEEILRGVLARMRLSEDEFRAWLSQQGGLARVLGGGGEP
jgi:hypothetical protein